MTDAPPSSQFCSACGKQQPITYRFCEYCGAALTHPTPAPPPDAAEPREDMLNQIRAELEDLKAIALAFGVERIRDGSWFNEFIHAMLAPYAQRIIVGGGIAFFRTKYPGLTRNQIAEKLCDLATRYAALAGGASG